MEEDKKINYPICKQHHIIQKLPVFKILKKGLREKGIERKYQSKDGKTKVTIRMFKQLDIGDQDLLLAILSIALPVGRGKMLSCEKDEEYSPKELWTRLQTKGILAKWDTLHIETKTNELLGEVGKTKGGTNAQWLKESLVRLANTNIEIETENYIGSTNFVSYIICKDTKQIQIAINPINALILLNAKNGYILHNRHERLSLKAPARALYSILVGIVNIHGSRTLTIETLIEKIYLIKWEETISQQKKNLRRSFRTAIEEISKLKKWNIIDNKNKTITVKRE